MVVRQQTRVGLSRERSAASIAARIAAASCPSTPRMTFHPYASNRAGVSSVNQPAVSPSMLMWLSSQKATSLCKPQVPASEATSCEMPSIRQPSPRNTQVRWSTISKPSRLNRCASSFSARAKPTALARPCPSGPVVVSTPGVMKFSGWPGVFESSWRNAFRSSMERS